MQFLVREDECIHTKDYLSYAADNRYCAYGNFLDFFNMADNQVRQTVISDRPKDDDIFPIDAAIISAVVEVLVKKHNLKMPEWVKDRKYILSVPFYNGVTNKDYQALLKETALPEFAKRNLFLGNDCMSRA